MREGGYSRPPQKDTHFTCVEKKKKTIWSQGSLQDSCALGYCVGFGEYRSHMRSHFAVVPYVSWPRNEAIFSQNIERQVNLGVTE